MAKRRKKVQHRRRRRRIGALSMTAGSPLIKYGSIAAGYLLANTLNQGLIDKIFGTPTDPAKTGKMIAIGQMGLGGALLFTKLAGKKTMLTEVAGGLMLGAGLKRAMVVFKAGATTMSGYGGVPVIGAYRAPGQLGRRVAGYGDVPVVGAYNTNSALNGAKVMGSMGGDKTSNSGSTLVG